MHLICSRWIVAREDIIYLGSNAPSAFTQGYVCNLAVSALLSLVKHLMASWGQKKHILKNILWGNDCEILHWACEEKH